MALPGDGAVGGAELGGDVANGFAAGGEAADDLLLFGCGEVVVGDVVTREGALHGDLVDVVPLGLSGGRRGGVVSVSMSSQASGGSQPCAAAWARAASAAGHCSLVARAGRAFHRRW
jgi:hypothetical protein